jgi:putative addiction module CopG family antidote
MEISLPPKIAEFVETQVQSGKYESVNAVISAGIELLAQQADRAQDYTPQTSLGEQLWSIRQRAVADGMPLQPAEDIAEAISTERNRQHTRDEDLS